MTCSKCHRKALQDDAQCVFHTPKARHIRHDSRGLLEEPIGFHVMLPGDDRDLIGEVYGHHVAFSGLGVVLDVHFFNGEEWPVMPFVDEVVVLF